MLRFDLRPGDGSSGAVSSAQVTEARPVAQVAAAGRPPATPRGAGAEYISGMTDAH